MNRDELMPRQFTEYDWHGYNGAEKINLVHQPLITETDQYVLIGDDKGLELSFLHNDDIVTATLPLVPREQKLGFIRGLMYAINAYAHCVSPEIAFRRVVDGEKTN